MFSEDFYLIANYLLNKCVVDIPNREPTKSRSTHATTYTYKCIYVLYIYSCPPFICEKCKIYFQTVNFRKKQNVNGVSIYTFMLNTKK